MLEAPLVTIDLLRHRLADVVDEILALCVGMSVEHEVDIVHDLVEGELLLVQLEVALFEASEIQDIIGEALKEIDLHLDATHDALCS